MITGNLRLCLCSEVFGNVSLIFTGFRVGNRHNWELCIQGAWTWYHLESFSSCFFCFWSSCSRLRPAAVCSSRRPASSRQSCSLHGCWMMRQQWWSWRNKSNCSLPAEEGEKKNRRRLVLQSWLFMLPSSASPGASAVVCSAPGGEPGGGVSVGTSGYEKSLDAW